MTNQEKYFKGTSGVYYLPDKNWLIHIEQTEPYCLYDKKNNCFSTIKRYNLNYGNMQVNKVAVRFNKNLIYLGEL